MGNTIADVSDNVIGNQIINKIYETKDLVELVSCYKYSEYAPDNIKNAFTKWRIHRFMNDNNFCITWVKDLFVEIRIILQPGFKIQVIEITYEQRFLGSSYHTIFIKPLNDFVSIEGNGKSIYMGNVYEKGYALCEYVSCPLQQFFLQSNDIKDLCFFNNIKSFPKIFSTGSDDLFKENISGDSKIIIHDEKYLKQVDD